jgi:hypothetical protein
MVRGIHRCPISAVLLEKHMTEKEVLNTQIKLELPLGAVNMVLAALAKQPYEAVADLVQVIKEQAIPQVPVPDVKAEVASASE